MTDAERECEADSDPVVSNPGTVWDPGTDRCSMRTSEIKVPSNQGSFQPTDVIAPKGSIRDLNFLAAAEAWLPAKAAVHRLRPPGQSRLRRLRSVSVPLGRGFVYPCGPSQLAGAATSAEAEWLSNADAWRADATDRKNTATACRAMRRCEPPQSPRFQP